MITLIYSKEPAMARRGLAKLVKASCSNPDEFNYISFNMAVTDIDTLAEEAEMLPLGYEKKTIAAEDCAFLGKSKGNRKSKEKIESKLLDYLANPNEQIDLFLTYYGESLDEKNPYVEAIKKVGQIKEMKMPSDEEWASTTRSFFAKRGISIEEDALAEFLKRINKDYGKFLTEREKLACYASAGELTKADIKKLVSPHLEEDAFKLGNCLILGKVAQAIKVYRDLKEFNIDEIRLIGMLSSSFRFMEEVAYLEEKGLSSSDIARTLGTSPMRVEISLRNLRGVDKRKLEENQEALYELDKMILQGQIDPELGFNLYLANFQI